MSYTWKNEEYMFLDSGGRYLYFNLVMSHLQKLRDRGEPLRKKNFQRMCKRLKISQHKTYSELLRLGVLRSDRALEANNFQLHIHLERNTAYEFNALRFGPSVTCVVKGQTSLVRSSPYSDTEWCGTPLFFKWQTWDVEFDVSSVTAQEHRHDYYRRDNQTVRE
ncbi:hypothetical protein NVP1285O_34 [Vibrio phage 1.285.O._10N.286.55.C12]|nr:hypothetical protein NVP1285O_34 [Vibrio phage 1.285.O._10N.286.55.C12]